MLKMLINYFNDYLVNISFNLQNNLIINFHCFIHN